MNLSWAMLSALLVKTGTSAARSVDTALRRGVERSLKQHTVHHVAAASSSATDLSKRHYTSETTIPGTVDDALELFEAFAVDELHGWRKVSAFVEPHGRAQAVFSGQFSIPVRLEPRTAWARMREGIEACHDTAKPLMTSVPYRYALHIYFEPTDSGVRVAHSTTETVAPFGLLDRDVTYHYEAPPLPRGIGAVGDRFIDYVRASAGWGA